MASKPTRTPYQLPDASKQAPSSSYTSNNHGIAANWAKAVQPWIGERNNLRGKETTPKGNYNGSDGNAPPSAGASIPVPKGAGEEIIPNELYRSTHDAATRQQLRRQEELTGRQAPSKLDQKVMYAGRVLGLAVSAFGAALLLATTSGLSGAVIGAPNGKPHYLAFAMIGLGAALILKTIKR